MKWALIGVAAVTTVAVTLGGEYLLSRVTAADYAPPSRFAVAEPHPEFGPGAPSNLDDARLLDGGVLQVLTTGGACDALSSVDTDETTGEVRVSLRVASLDRPCTANPVPWFVTVPLDAPLGDRALIDATTGRAQSVTDCTVTPAPSRGICVVGPDAG